MRSLAPIIVLLIATTACGNDAFPTEDDRPPDLVVSAGDEQVTLTPYSYCWSRREGATTLNVCTDGIPSEPLPTLTLAEGSELSALFPLPWVVTALLQPSNGDCGPTPRVEVDIDGAPIAVPGPVGTYRVEFFGRGAEGDGSWAIELMTTEPGEPIPATVQVSWHPATDVLDSTASFSASVGDAYWRQSSATADITVVAGTGTTAEFSLVPAASLGCDGEIGFEGAPGLTASIVDLGSPPYAITVTARIDGTVVISDPVVWPDDFSENSDESARVGAEIVSP